MGTTFVHLLAETRSRSRHTALGVAPVDNTIGGDSKNTVMKKSFQLLAVVVPEREKRKAGRLKGIYQQITCTFPDFNHGIIPSFLSKACLPKQTDLSRI